MLKQTAARTKKLNVRKMVTMAMLCALGVILVAIIEVPLFPSAPFLKYDPADIPILIGTMLYGPAAGVLMTVVVSFIQSFMIHGSSGPIGFFMHVIATSAMVVATGLIYRNRRKTMASAAIALVVGVFTMTVAMVGVNLVITPWFMGVPVEMVQKMLIPTIIPFNLIKAGINCGFTFIIYKAVEKIALK